ncbi:lanthionine synthetase LanC family protein [Kitasatospora cineracea]|uniref:class III lanthionine synthetase LanKC N-terminal domain-containing protein n=1 Tax=Kitasatospora cineracea TaxID=88074 RepID=UPI00343FE748
MAGSRARGGGGDWTVAVEGSWCTVRPPGREPPAQGWELHVGAASAVAFEVLSAVAAAVADDPCAFGFAADRGILRGINAHDCAMESSGKFITVRPGDDEQFRRLAAELHLATTGMPGPVIPTARPYRPGSLVHYRYGASAARPVLGNDGVYRPVLRTPGGDLVEDRPGRRPPWVADPVEGAGSATGGRPLPGGVRVPAQPGPGTRHGGGALLDGRWARAGALRHDAGGGVFLGTDRTTGAEVVVTQARAHIEVDRAGTDARTELRRRAALLDRLSGSGLTPRVHALIERPDALFLVQERLPGRPLDDWVADRLRPDGTPGVPWTEAGPLALALLDLVERAHRHGVALPGLTPGHILVTPDGHPRLTGLRGATPATDTLDLSALSGLYFLLATGHLPPWLAAGLAVGGWENGATAEGWENGARAEGWGTGRTAEGRESGPGAEGRETGWTADGQESGARSQSQATGRAAEGQAAGPTADGQESGARGASQATGRAADGQAAGPTAKGRAAGRTTEEQAASRATEAQEGRPQAGRTAEGQGTWLAAEGPGARPMAEEQGPARAAERPAARAQENQPPAGQRATDRATEAQEAQPPAGWVTGRPTAERQATGPAVEVRGAGVAAEGPGARPMAEEQGPDRAAERPAAGVQENQPPAGRQATDRAAGAQEAQPPAGRPTAERWLATGPAVEVRGAGAVGRPSRLFGGSSDRLLELAVRAGGTARRLAPVVCGLRVSGGGRGWGPSRVRAVLVAGPGPGPVGPVVPPSLDRLLHDGLRRLARCAAPERSDRLWAAGPEGVRTDPCNVQHGAAGVLAVLARAAATAPLPAPARDRARVTVGVAAAWVERRCAAEPVVLPGLYYGRSGTAWALFDAAAALGDPGLAERAAGLAARVPLGCPAPGLAHGAAGAGLVQLRAYRATGARLFLDRAARCVRGLLAAAQDGPGGTLWPVPADFDSAMAGTARLGHAHGVAGVGTFLLAAATALAADGCPGHAATARDARAGADRAARTLAAAVRRDGPAARWPRHPDDPGPVRPDRGCDGAAGVGAFLLRYWRATGDEPSRELALAAGRAVLDDRWRCGTGACHGLAGDGEYLLDLAEATGRSRFRQGAHRLAALIAARAALRDGLLLLPDADGTGWATGTAGRLAFLLRLRHGGPRLWSLPEG